MQMDQLVHEVHAGRQMQYGTGKMHLMQLEDRPMANQFL